MSFSGIDRIEDIINPVNITNWYKADTLTGNTGDLVTRWEDSSGNGNFLFQNVNASKPRFIIDSQGFRCLNFPTFSGGTQMFTPTQKNYNVDETFIVIAKINGTAGGSFRFQFRSSLVGGGGFNRLFTNANAIFTEATDYALDSGQGRYLNSTQGLNKFSCSSQRSVSEQKIKTWFNSNYRTNSFTNTTYNNPIYWTIGGNTPQFDVNVYEMIAIDRYLDDVTTKKLIRNLSFRNGLLI